MKSPDVILKDNQGNFIPNPEKLRALLGKEKESYGDHSNSRASALRESISRAGRQTEALKNECKGRFQNSLKDQVLSELNNELNGEIDLGIFETVINDALSEMEVAIQLCEEGKDPKLPKIFKEIPITAKAIPAFVMAFYQRGEYAQIFKMIEANPQLKSKLPTDFLEQLQRNLPKPSTKQSNTSPVSGGAPGLGAIGFGGG